MQPRLAPFVRRARGRLPKQVSQDLSELAFLLGPPAPAPFAFPEGPAVGVPRRSRRSRRATRTSSGRSRCTSTAPSPSGCAEDGSRAQCSTSSSAIPTRVAGRLLSSSATTGRTRSRRSGPTSRHASRSRAPRPSSSSQSGGIGSLLSSSTRRARLAEGGIAVTPTIPAEIDVAGARGRAHAGRDQPLQRPVGDHADHARRRARAACAPRRRRPRHDAEHRARAGARRDRRPDAPDPSPPRRRPAAVDPRARAAARAERGRRLEAPAPARRRAARARASGRGTTCSTASFPERAVAASEALLAFLRVPSDSPTG